MEFSSICRASLYNTWNLTSSNIGDKLTYYNICFNNNNVTNKFFVMDISSDEIDIPVFARGAIESVINTNMITPSLNPFTKVIIPLYANTLTCNRNTSDSILNLLFRNSAFRDKLVTIKTNKGSIYYGNRGIILNKDFEPIILCCIRCRKVKKDLDTFMEYYKPIIYVSPKVFIDNTDLICKYTVKKIIPFYLESSINFIVTSTGRFKSNITANTKPQVLIEDINNIVSPNKPSPKYNMNEKLNEVLIDNIDSIMDHISI